jgi:hypothetical protein
MIWCRAHPAAGRRPAHPLRPDAAPPHHLAPPSTTREAPSVIRRHQIARSRPFLIAVLLVLACLVVLGAWALVTREEIVVRGGIAEYYAEASHREALGEPEANERCGLPEGGCLQEFERGTVYWAPGRPATHVAEGDILEHYADAGGPEGAYGHPVGEVVRQDPRGGFEYLRTHDPASGTWYWLVSAGEGDVVPVDASGAIGRHWEEHRDELGAPEPGTEGERCTDHGVCRQDFRGGTLVWSSRTGVHAVSGAFRDRYEDAMGAPRGGEYVGPEGVTVQEFSHPAEGTLEVMTRTEDDDVAHHAVRGALADLYAAAGGARGELGPPLGGEETGLRDGGVRQRFAGGTAYWSPGSGAAAVTDRTAALAWQAQGAEEGPWGYPVSGPRELGRVRAQDFEAGTAEVSEDGFSRFTPGAALSGAPEELMEGTARQHDLGPARGGVEELEGGGRYQRHEDGVVVLTPSGEVVAMDDGVFRTWRERPDATGAPRMSADRDGRLVTRFSEGDLARVPERGDAVLRVSAGLGAGDALVIGDSQLGEGDHGASWVAQAIRRNGYAPHYEARPGIGVAADASRDRFGSYYQGVVEGRWILPGGDPGIVYVQGSGNDSYGTSPAEVRDKMTRTVQRLKEVYPGSRIVMTGLISRQGATGRDRVSDVLEQVAREQGALFVPLKGKVTEWGAAPFLRDGLHFRAPEGHDYMAERYAPYLKRFLEG